MQGQIYHDDVGAIAEKGEPHVGALTIAIAISSEAFLLRLRLRLRLCIICYRCCCNRTNGVSDEPK
jgi:hypothetical protein